MRGGERVFVVLNVIERESGGIINGLRNLLFKPETYLESVELPGVRFAVIKASCAGDELNWGKIERICGAYSDRVLIPDGIHVPDNSKIKAPPLRLFGARVLTRTACEIIKLSRIPMYRRVLGIIDPGGAFSDNLPELLMHYTSVRVVTENTQKYAAESARIMDEIGAPVMVSGNTDCLGECAVILAPDGLPERNGHRFPCPVIAGGFLQTAAPNTAAALRITPGKSLLDACPEGIDPHLFAGAAYEFCGALSPASAFLRYGSTLSRDFVPNGMSGADFGNFVADKLFFRGRETGISDVVRAVIECAGLQPESFILRKC